MERMTITGTPFEIGKTLGEIGRPCAGLIASTAEQDTHAGDPGRSAATRLLDRVREFFPQYWDELKGMSVGLGLDMLPVFLWNCRLDFAGAADAAGSSTVAIHRLGYGIVLHKLCLGPVLARQCRLVEVNPRDKPGFLSLYVPGCIPGAHFSANRAGIVQVVDHIYGEKPGSGFPSFIVSRAVLDAQSLPEAIDIVMACERYGSAHHVLASTHEFLMFRVAATPADRLPVPIPNTHWHTNHLPRKPGIAHTAAAQASYDRYAALENLIGQMPSHPTEDDVLALLEGPAAASTILPAQGEIGTAFIKIRPKRIDVRMYSEHRTDRQSCVVAVD